MAKLTVVFGLLLIGNGIYGYTGSQSEKKSHFAELDTNSDQTLAIEEQESVFDKYSKLKEHNAPVDLKEFLDKTVSITTLIPAFLGIVLLLCGIGSIVKPALNMHLMHVAALLGVLGCLAALGRLIPSFFKENQNSLAQLNLGLMALLCGGFVYSCIQSFKAAGRRRREAAKAADAGQSSGAADSSDAEEPTDSGE